MKRITKEEMARYIALTCIKGLGPVGQNCLLDVCKNIDGCFNMAESELTERCRRVPGSSRYMQALLRERDNPELINKADCIMNDSTRESIAIITRADERYPVRFKSLTDMPVVLYVKGKLMINQYENSVGIVGARRCSRDAREKTIKLARQCALERTAIISGMAKGVDSYAHTAALKNKGYTIAVLGSGPDICYPSEHYSLYQALVSHGCILSEYPPGTVPKGFRFPVRNRIIAGLSDQLWVIGAGRSSGTQTTVEACQKYGHRATYISGL